jgi:hypothetical protein
MEMMRLFWDAAGALDASAAALDEGRRFPICKPEPLATLFASAGLRDVRVDAIDIPTRFTGFDDYWTPFLMGDAPAPGYCASLSAAQRNALRERLRSTVPSNEDGIIELTARAWVARGSKPGMED